MSEINEVRVAAADLASLEANTRVVERFEWRQRLRKEPCLHLLCNFKFLARAALCFDFSTYLVEANQNKGVPVSIVETRERCVEVMRRGSSWWALM